MNQTTNYSLPQWGAADRVRRGDFNSAMSKIDAQLKTNADAVATKAASSTVSALQTTVGKKADSSTVSALQTTVNGLKTSKADASAVSALQTALGGKADASTVSALAAALGSHGHNCRIACGTYIGTGEGSGAQHPTVYEVGFYPVIAICGTITPFGAEGNFSWMFRDSTTATEGNNYSSTLTVRWSDTAVSFYGRNDLAQYNHYGYTYGYCILGWDA